MSEHLEAAKQEIALAIKAGKKTDVAPYAQVGEMMGCIVNGLNHLIAAVQLLERERDR